MAVTWECSRDGLEPQFLADIEDVLGHSPFKWNVVYGYRSLALQAKLWLAYKLGKGVKAAPPGLSAHNYGLAVDVQLIVNGKQDWNQDHIGWKWLFATCKLHPRLHCGVDFGDADHIQRFNWKAFKGWASRSARNA